MMYNQFIKAFTFAALNTLVGLCSTRGDVFYLKSLFVQKKKKKKTVVNMSNEQRIAPHATYRNLNRKSTEKRF